MNTDHSNSDNASGTELASGIMIKLADRGMSQISLLRDAWPFLSGSVLHCFDLIETRYGPPIGDIQAPHGLDLVETQYGTRLGDIHIHDERVWRDVVDQHLTVLAHNTSPTEQVRSEFTFCGKEEIFGENGSLVLISFDIEDAQMVAEVRIHELLGAGRYPHLLIPSPKSSRSIEMILAWFAHATDVLRAKYGSPVSFED